VSRPPRRVALLVEYEGTRYAGFQVQPHAPTVQGALEEALYQLTGVHSRVQGAGRTDAGAHARMQVVAFTTEAPYPLQAFVEGLNAHLPPDIRVWGAVEAPKGFDPRRHALRREYHYHIWNHPAPPALWRGFAHHEPRTLDLPAMRQALAYLVGERDFAPFARAPSRPGTSTVRRLERAHLGRMGRLVVLCLVGNAFLPGQVRHIAGALVQVGLGRLTVEGFRALAEQGAPGPAGPALPACGLCLMRVEYPPALWQGPTWPPDLIKPAPERSGPDGPENPEDLHRPLLGPGGAEVVAR